MLPVAEPSAIVYVVELTTFKNPIEDDDSYKVDVLGVFTSREAAQLAIETGWMVDAWEEDCRPDDNDGIIWAAWIDLRLAFKILPFHLNGKYCLTGEFAATPT